MVKNKDSYCLFSFATELVGLISAAPFGLRDLKRDCLFGGGTRAHFLNSSW